MIKAITIISFETIFLLKRDISSLFFVTAIKLCLLPNIFVYNTKQQQKKYNSNEKPPNYYFISVINMYSWLLCTKANRCPGERMGCRSQTYLLLSHETCRRCGLAQQPLTTGDALQEGTSLTQDTARTLEGGLRSEPHCVTKYSGINNQGTLSREKNPAHISQP